MIEALANEEDQESHCAACPIGDPEYCPDLDQLSYSVIKFSSRWDHVAHEGYREALWAQISPILRPEQVEPWMLRREVYVETQMEIAQERNKPKEPGNG